MLIYDDTFVAAMTATTQEATALGARAYGSEHLLLGLLRADDHLTQQVVRACPGLTVPAVRDAVRGAVDDAPHLARLGLAADDPAVTAPAAGQGGRLRVKHTPELQSASNQASVKWAHLRRAHALPKERTASSAVLWLAVLEPSARAPRLLEAMGIDPDGVRAAVLSALVPAGAGVVTWPTEAPVGPVMRLVHALFERTNIAR
ncbi:Clp protease N-terminal domain-containing protein [Cellulomonas phragmiteti]|uniref:Clp R domain-containing protein n=1 Tax=Cellulomonas phragmiteti TaxID=478780 RepID=A0ABQ4DPR1_9CELL|nr:Clp protease N-terminal domain-containing protein [Cellulomonas phragmiteti]GIG41355.1 hypothetical protein Cph01nite_31170 [Cellulomonas phragmiteti]